MTGFIKKHPLIFIILIAIMFRLPSVFFSQGYIHSDDHFDSIEVAYDWLRDGPSGENGYLRWKNWSSGEIGRFPLYALSQYAVMKVYKAIGITSLHTMMFGIRFLHMLFSLIPILAAYGIVRVVSGSSKYAIYAGAFIAVNFALPFLSVRNLIEIVGGNLWAGALFFFYRYQYQDRRPKWLYAAGIITGLAWMIRFQIAFAVLPIPFILWYEEKSIRSAVQYSLAVLAMLLLSGVFDLFVLGSFASSTIRNVTLNTSLGALYKTIALMYPATLLVFLVPPFSLVACYLMFRPSFIAKHRILFFSCLSFIVCHMSHANQQERFIFPIIPAMLIMIALAVWEKWKRDGYILKFKRIFSWVLSISLCINMVFVFYLMVSSGHQGQINSLVWIEKMRSRPSFLLFQPEISQWAPMDYAGLEPLEYASIRDWKEMDVHRTEEWQSKHWDYILIYPRLDEDLSRHLDSAQALFGELEFVGEFEPSHYDNLLHALNPRHNPSFACWIYRSVQN